MEVATAIIWSSPLWKWLPWRLFEICAVVKSTKVHNDTGWDEEVSSSLNNVSFIVKVCKSRNIFLQAFQLVVWDEKTGARLFETRAGSKWRANQKPGTLCLSRLLLQLKDCFLWKKSFSVVYYITTETILCWMNHLKSVQEWTVYYQLKQTKP